MADTIIQTDHFEDVHEAERLCLARRADGAGAVQGLALSGGGIRSASFAMGVMQALEAGGKLNAFQYLSTVSGGGYTGGSFSWFKAAKGGNCPTFPFGQLHQGARDPHPSMATRILNHIRQRANYLEPGYGFNSLSLVSVVLRTSTLIALGYMGLAALLFFIGIKLDLFLAVLGKLNPLLLTALGLVGLQAVLALVYSIGTGIPMRSSNLRYLSRRRLQVAGGRLLTLTLGLVVLGGLPILAALVAKYSSDMLGWALTALGAKDNAAEVKVFADWFQTGDTVVRSAVFGAVIFLFAPIAAIKIFNKQGNDAPGGLFVGLGAASAVFGMLFLAYAWALYAHTENAIWPIGVAAGAVVLALVRNSNLFSLHCMYRDRLMEAFMPDSNVQPTNAWESAKAADKFQLSSILPCNGNPHCDTCKGPTAPFHLINTNAVLPDSHDVRYSGRAGDSFLLSPLFCGSNATGWMATRKYMRDGVRDGLSLASAVAISGAAVNGHTGPTPSSVTRNGFVSLLMSLFGLQLGVWVTNPRGTRWPLQPNDIVPGLNSLLGARMDGKASFVQLSDGGHFENLAIYELIRRGVQTIVVSDAGADPDYAFEDLGNAVEKVRVDFGVIIDFASTELDGILPGSATGGTLPDKYKLAKRGYAVGTIRYPGKPPGRLFYIKATLVDNLPADLYAYRAVNAAFPNDTTADQFFDEDQFEAYRGLGYALGWQLIEEQGAALSS